MLDPKQVVILSRGDPCGHPSAPPGLVRGLRVPFWAQSTDLGSHVGPPAPIWGTILVVFRPLFSEILVVVSRRNGHVYTYPYTLSVCYETPSFWPESRISKRNWQTRESRESFLTTSYCLLLSLEREDSGESLGFL